MNTDEPYSVIGWCISVVQHPLNTEEALLSNWLVYFSSSTPSEYWEAYSVIAWCISVLQHPMNTEEALLSDWLVYFSCSTPNEHWGALLSDWLVYFSCSKPNEHRGGFTQWLIGVFQFFSTQWTQRRFYWVIDWCISYWVIDWCISYWVIDWCISVLQHPMNTEEANLLYVAVTRAKRALIMSKTIRMVLSTMGVSRCVSELYWVSWGWVVVCHFDTLGPCQRPSELNWVPWGWVVVYHFDTLWPCHRLSELYWASWEWVNMCLMDHAYRIVCFSMDVITCVCVSGWMASPVHISGWMASPVHMFQGGCHHLCTCFRVDGITCVRDHVNACFYAYFMQFLTPHTQFIVARNAPVSGWMCACYRVDVPVSGWMCACYRVGVPVSGWMYACYRVDVPVSGWMYACYRMDVCLLLGGCVPVSG